MQYQFLYLLRYWLIALLVTIPSTLLAQDGYPASSEIAASALNDSQRALMTSLINLPSRDKEREKIKKLLCTESLVRSDAALKAALTVVESQIKSEILFDNVASSGLATEGQKFSLLVDLGEDAVLLKSSHTRFASEAAGLSVTYPYDHTRPIWLEGKENTSVLILIPPIRDCSTRSIVVCPRIYSPRGELLKTRYAPVGARYFVNTKADGLFATVPKSAGKIRASIRTTKGLAVPAIWFKDNINATTPSVALKYTTPEGAEDPLPNFISSGLPILGAVESRLDFGTEEHAARTVWSRTTVEVSPFAIVDWPKVHVRNADLKVEPGECFMVTHWRERQL